MSSKKILIVDGDVAFAEILKMRLEDRGYVVDCTSRGKEALDILKTRWVDLIVIAIVLQGAMNGYYLFNEIKKKKDLSGIPILVGSNKASMKKTFESMGADIFLTKPYSINIFLKKIKNIFTKRTKEVHMQKRVKPKMKDLTKKLKLIKAKDIMTKDVITTKEDTSLAEIAKLMIKTRISGIPVIGKKGKLSGVITATDLFLVMDMIKSGDIVGDDMMPLSNPTVKFALSTGIIKIKKNTTLEEIITIMKYQNVHTLPVFEKNKLVGVIGRRDVFKNFYSTVKNLY